MSRKKWRTITGGVEKNHPSEPATYRWIWEQPVGTDVRVEVNEGYRWEWYEQVVVTANGVEPV